MFGLLQLITMDMSQTYTQVGYVKDIQIFLKKYFDLFALPEDQSNERAELEEKQRAERDEERDRIQEEADKANEEKEDAAEKVRDAEEEEKRL